MTPRTTSTVEFDQTPGAYVEVDLKLIREKRGVSVEQIHLRTKIPVEVLQQFEQGALTNEPQFNRVYLRAIVRTYAEQIGISPELAVESLEASFSGRYQGELARKYLDVDLPEPAPLPTEEPLAEDTAESTEVIGASPKTPDTTPQHNVEHARRPMYQVDVRPPLRWGRVVAVIVISVAVAVALWVILSMGNSPGVHDQQAAVPDPVDTHVPRPTIVLGTEITVVVIAADAALSPLRVSIDGGTQYPHWVERGDSLELSGANRFELTGDLGSARILVEGEQWYTEDLGDRSSLTLTRESIESHFNSPGRAVPSGY